MTTPLIIPPPLQEGDKIAIVSPAGIARAGDVYQMCRVLRERGFQVQLMPHAMGRHGSYSGTVDERFSDMAVALQSPDIKAIICTRGGYGAVQLLDKLDRLDLRQNPKWLVGFSDICALHCLFRRHNIASIHGPMAKHISANAGNNDDFRELLNALTGNKLHYTINPSPLNIKGTACGTLVGGNLSVVSALLATRFNVIMPGSILLIEDIAEPIYKIQRILYQLKLAGLLESLAGMVVGAFTNYVPDSNYQSMEQMISDMVGDLGFPVAFNFPVGHGGRSMPLVLGAETKLTVASDSATLEQS